MSSETTILKDNEDVLIIDIINALSKRYMEEIAELIFSYLDYESVKNSEMVSRVWYNTVLCGNTWKNQLKRHIVDFPEWNNVMSILQQKFSKFLSSEPKDRQYYRTLCQAVGETVKNLKQNWRNGHHTTYLFQPFSQAELNSIYWIPGSLTFEMDRNWIGRGQRDGSVVLYNRWTETFVAKLEPSLDRDGYYGCRTVRCLQFNSDLLVAGYFTGEICVWNIKTAELIYVFDEIDVVGRASHYIPLNGLSLAGSSGSYWLLSSLTSPRNRDFVTLRELKYPSDDEVTLNRIMFDRHLGVEQLLVKIEHFFILLADSRSKKSHIEVRCILTTAVLRTIQLPHAATGGFSYFSFQDHAFILTGSGETLQLWNAESGKLFFQVKSNTTIVFVQSIGNLLLSCNIDGLAEVWDWNSGLNLQEGCKPVCSVSLLEVSRPLLCSVIRADEYQIAMIPDRSEDYSDLYIIDFVQLDSLQHLN